MPSQNRGSFLPKTDKELLGWSHNFATLISENPMAYGLKAALATEYFTKYRVFEMALRIAKHPSTRTASAIATKDFAKLDLQADSRYLARVVFETDSITEDQKVALGLTVVKSEKSKRNPVGVTNVHMFNVACGAARVA